MQIAVGGKYNDIMVTGEEEREREREKNALLNNIPFT